MTTTIEKLTTCTKQADAYMANVDQHLAAIDKNLRTHPPQLGWLESVDGTIIEQQLNYIESLAEALNKSGVRVESQVAVLESSQNLLNRRKNEIGGGLVANCMGRK